jgi:uncharacterized protein (TIGR00156 family)
MTRTFKQISLALAAVSIFSFASVASAQYVGPSSQTAPRSVADILKNPVDDQAVVLRGFILRKVGNEKYIFSDGTAEIRVDIDNKLFPLEKIDDKVKVELRGEVEKEFMETPEIDVDVLMVVR